MMPLCRNLREIKKYEYFNYILLLDIDPTGKPDLLCDARELTSTPAA